MYAPNNEPIQSVNRTICIGLGGTGKDILMRIRRLIIDRYGDLANLPVVSFVHIDTDKGANKRTNLRTGKTYRGIDLTFVGNESVSATMTSVEVQEFAKHLRSANNDIRGNPYSHIARWFPNDLIHDLDLIEDGAKGIRPVGRLAFFHKYREIAKSIASAEIRTRDQGKFLLEKFGLKVDNNLTIFVACSLLGGTGSGMFLDVAYSLRKKFPNAKVIAYLVISPDLYGREPSMYANTYAALKELDYYSTPGTVFEAVYDVQNVVFMQDSRAPFSYTYLVSNYTKDSTYQIFDQGKLCNVIAQKISLDFTSDLASVIISNRDNFNDSLSKTDLHPRPNVQRYLTFGLASIYFPRDRVLQRSLAQISRELIQFWIEGNVEVQDSQEILNNFLMQYNWKERASQQDGVVKQLMDSPVESNKSFSELIERWKEVQRKQIESGDPDNLGKRIVNSCRERFIKADAANASSDWLRLIQEKRSSLIIQLEKNVDEYLEKLLNPQESQFSLNSVIDWLEALKTELNNRQIDLQSKIETLQGYRSREELQRLWDKTQDLRGAVAAKPSILASLFGGKDNKSNSGNSEILRCVTETARDIRHNCELKSYYETMEIVIAIQKYIIDKSSRVAEFVRAIRLIQDQYIISEENLKQIDSEEITGEAIYRDEDVIKVSEILIPKDRKYLELTQLTYDVLENIGIGRSVSNLVGRNLTDQQIMPEISLAVERVIAPRTKNITPSVIDTFMQKYPVHSDIRLEEILLEAKPLLNLKLDNYFYDGESKNKVIVGFRDTNEPAVVSLKKILKNNGIANESIKHIQESDSILFVEEFAGFPLRIIDGLNEFQQHYIRGSSNAFNTRPLHIDASKEYPDFIPPDAEIFKTLEKSFFGCLAMAYDSSTFTVDNSGIIIKYEETWSINKKELHLTNVWHEALDKLISNKLASDTLAKLLEDVKQYIFSSPVKWEEIYRGRLEKFEKKTKELTVDDSNHIYKSLLLGEGSSPEGNLLAQEGLISSLRREIEQKLGFRNTRPQNSKEIKPLITQKAEDFNNSKDDFIDVEVEPTSTPNKDESNKQNEKYRSRSASSNANVREEEDNVSSQNSAGESIKENVVEVEQRADYRKIFERLVKELGEEREAKLITEKHYDEQLAILVKKYYLP